MALTQDPSEGNTGDAVRNNIKDYFGNPSDSAWQHLLQTNTLAYKNASRSKNKFPLVIGMLRPFSTTTTCELLASHGYVVAMINQADDFPPDDSLNWNKQMSKELLLYDASIDWLVKNNFIERGQVGLLGFSGSGFSQFLYSMQSNRPKCLALLESGVYAKGLFNALKNSGKYSPKTMTIPLLYLYSHKMELTNPYRDEFLNLNSITKQKILYLDSAMKHWDFATEGFISNTYLNNRHPIIAERQKRNFINIQARLIDFFNVHLKGVKTEFVKQFPSAAKVLYKI